MEQKKEEQKEEFCGACVAGLTALVGVAGTSMGSKASKNKQTKKIIFWVSVSVTVISILIAIYLLKTCKDCK
jgi:uncharacterized membrane protein YvbJ